MSVIRPERPADKLPSVTTAEIEGKSREFVRKESSRPAPNMDSEVTANSICAVLQRVAGTSLADIDDLVAQLTQLRDHLQHEARRVQSEIVGYAQISQAALQSTKAIAQGLAKFKRTVGGSPSR